MECDEWSIPILASRRNLKSCITLYVNFGVNHEKFFLLLSNIELIPALTYGRYIPLNSIPLQM